MTTQRKKQTPTQTIRKWISNFVTKPNPVFGDLPPCPYAQKAMVDNKVEFVELNATADWTVNCRGSTITHNTSFSSKSVFQIN